MASTAVLRTRKTALGTVRNTSEKIEHKTDWMYFKSNFLASGWPGVNFCAGLWCEVEGYLIGMCSCLLNSR